MEISIIKGKLQTLSGEGERVRVRFALQNDQGSIGDFLLKPDHPALEALRINKSYEILIRETET